MSQKDFFQWVSKTWREMKISYVNIPSQAVWNAELHRQLWISSKGLPYHRPQAKSFGKGGQRRAQINRQVFHFFPGEQSSDWKFSCSSKHPLFHRWMPSSLSGDFHPFQFNWWPCQSFNQSLSRQWIAYWEIWQKKYNHHCIDAQILQFFWGNAFLLRNF